VAADHFGGNGVDDITQGEKVFFLVEIIEEDDLEQEVPEFLADVARIVVVDCLKEFVGFLYELLFEGLGRLLLIPGTAIQRPEPADNFEEGEKFFRGARHGFACAWIIGKARGGNTRIECAFLSEPIQESWRADGCVCPTRQITKRFFIYQFAGGKRRRPQPKCPVF